MARKNNKDISKDDLFEALLANNFNVSDACNQLGVNRSFYYYYINNDLDFIKKIESTKKFLKNVTLIAVVSGLTNENAVLRWKYVDTLAKAGLLGKLLEIEESEEGLSLKDLVTTGTLKLV